MQEKFTVTRNGVTRSFVFGEDFNAHYWRREGLEKLVELGLWERTAGAKPPSVDAMRAAAAVTPPAPKRSGGTAGGHRNSYDLNSVLISSPPKLPEFLHPHESAPPQAAAAGQSAINTAAIYAARKAACDAARNGLAPSAARVSKPTLDAAAIYAKRRAALAQ